MSRNDNDIIYPTCNTVIACRISSSSITGKVCIFKCTEISILIALMISPYCSCNRGPWELYTQSTFHLITRYFFTVFIHQSRLNSRQRQGCKGRNRRSSIRYRRYHDSACFGLPPSINDWTVFVSDIVIIPMPSLLVNWFTDRSEHF